MEGAAAWEEEGEVAEEGGGVVLLPAGLSTVSVYQVSSYSFIMFNSFQGSDTKSLTPIKISS